MTPPSSQPNPILPNDTPLPFPIALTVDTHEEDRPSDVSRAAHWLQQRGIRATFFVPSALLTHPGFRPYAVLLPSLGHEVGSHGHRHDFVEIRALMRGRRADLDFLSRSRALFEEAFACAPTTFRSPAWCPLGPGTIDELVALGYRVDSSATPQRLPLFSSTPYANTWLFARRGAHELAPGLLEVPTSSLLLPAASPAFLTLRRRLSIAFVRLLLWEARTLPGRIACLQLHAGDLVPDAAPTPPLERLSIASFLPRSSGGLRFKVFLRERDPRRIYRITREIIDTLRGQPGARFVTLRDLTGYAAAIPTARTDGARPDGARPEG